MTNLVTVINNQAKTTSNIIADTFCKQHKDVLRRIEALEIPQDWRERNFALTLKTVEMPNGATRQDNSYEITRDGFTLLAMGFTGKKAMQFKIAYINAFNEMERRLSQPRQAQLSFAPVPYDITQDKHAMNAIGGMIKKCCATAIKETLFNDTESHENIKDALSVLIDFGIATRVTKEVEAIKKSIANDLSKYY